MVTLNSIYATAHIPYIRVTLDRPQPLFTIRYKSTQVLYGLIELLRVRGGGGLIIMVVVTDVSTASKKVIL